MGSWPSTLPSPQYAGYAISPVDKVVRSEMDGGNTKSRKRFTSAPDKISCSVQLTHEQFMEFRTWYESATGANGGAAWFTVKLFTGVGSYSVEQDVEARFSEQFSTNDGLKPQTIAVSMRLEVRYA